MFFNFETKRSIQFFERFLKAFCRVIEETFFKLNENRIFVRVINVCAFKTMVLYSSMLVDLFHTFSLLSMIFE